MGSTGTGSRGSSNSSTPSKRRAWARKENIKTLINIAKKQEQIAKSKNRTDNERRIASNYAKALRKAASSVKKGGPVQSALDIKQSLFRR